MPTLHVTHMEKVWGFDHPGATAILVLLASPYYHPHPTDASVMSGWNEKVGAMEEGRITKKKNSLVNIVIPEVEIT